MTTFALYTADGDVAVDDIEATSEEMLLLVKAANTKQPDAAPHYAVSRGPDDRVHDRLETDSTVDEKIVDEAIHRSGEDGDSA